MIPKLLQRHVIDLYHTLLCHPGIDRREETVWASAPYEVTTCFWMLAGGSSFPYQVPCSVLLAAKDQRVIGCRGLMEGLISPKWATAQDAYYRSIGSRRTGVRWSSLLVCQLWQVGITLHYRKHPGSWYVTET